MEKEKIKSCIRIILNQMVALIENSYDYDDTGEQKEKIKSDALELILGFIPEQEQQIVLQEQQPFWTDTSFTSKLKTFPFQDPTRTTCTNYKLNNKQNKTE